MFLLYILWDDWPIIMIPGCNEQLEQQLEYTLLKPDCHSWWISKMQYGREEERYAIVFCFLNLEKMPQKRMECFRLLLEHLAWIEHRFLSGIRDSRKAGSLRDDERSKEVNTPELIGQIKNFMDKDRRVSIETISAQFDVSVGTVHTIIHKELKMLKVCTKFVPRVLREDQKERRCHDSREMVKLINSDPTVVDALVTCDESWIYCYDPETKLPVEACWLSQTQEGQTEQIHPQTF